LNDNYFEEFISVRAEQLVQFAKYGISGGFATLVSTIIIYLVAWKIFPSLQEKDLFVVVFDLTVTEVDNVTRSLNSMLSNGVAFIFSNMVALQTL